ncbi:olfactory receptor 4F15-like [Pteropus vampyrus]|uniref:Olfactory receptor n=1 Tax=Pteropus vampyrus TaxID=132908 RepID=A0A6P3RRX1_PTEVA|nr:olfactory receptor 4F15-like [Pteropus vampyrus]
MDRLNDSVATEFLLLALSCSREKKLFLILICSFLYIGVIFGNLFILSLVIFDSHFHSLMYFLLANLSLIDMGLSSTTVPKIITDLINEYQLISFQSCMIQLCFIHIIEGVEMVLLIAMAFDRCTAIYKPLHYLKIMNPKICVLFVITGWVTGLIHAMSQFLFVKNLPFCGPNKVGSFYCDFPKIIKLACTNGDKPEFIVTANSGFMTMATFFLLIFSFLFILVTVWKHSSGDLSKAFVTLSSHITVVFLFFTPCVIFWPSPPPSLDKNLFVIDFAITPFLNPAIYTLRNEDIKVTIKRLYKKISYSRFC